MIDNSLTNPKSNWIAAANHLLSEKQMIAHAIIISVRGSAPREIGANMLISDAQIWNTIGGGSLEFEVMRVARELIQKNNLKPTALYRKVINLALGPDMGQCCGGNVKVLLKFWVDPILINC